VGPSVALPEHGPSEAPEEIVFLSATVYLLRAVGVPTDPEAAIPSSVELEGNKVPGGALLSTNSFEISRQQLWFCELEIIKGSDLRGVCIEGGLDTRIDSHSALLVRHMKFNSEQLKRGLVHKTCISARDPTSPQLVNGTG
jgi:hypothetical protein